MNIRTKITVIFFSVVIIVVTAISFSIYYFSANYREQDFYRRLRNRAINTAKVLTEVKEVNAELLKRMERNNPASLPNQYIVIYNHRNEELYSSDGTPMIFIDPSLLARIRREKEIYYDSGKYEALGFLFSDQLNHFTVVAAATDVYGKDALDNLRDILVITFCISLVFVSILGWVFAGRVLRPISRIVEEVSSITEMNLDLRLGEGNRNDELSKLAQTFNRLLTRLQNAFSSQKNFIANASHEIKTPLTVMSGEIEVALLKDRERTYYTRILRSVLSGIKSLNTLSTHLLLLAQSSADQPLSFSLIRIDDVLWEMKAELLKAFPTYRVDIHFDLNLDHESLVLRGDEQLIRTAILNLMDNGCKYSEDMRVIINLNSGDPAFITLNFVNSGNAIEHDQLQKIFTPFYRGKISKSKKGFGIGLSLVSSVIKLHQGEIAVVSTAESTRFTVKLPVKEISPHR